MRSLPSLQVINFGLVVIIHKYEKALLRQKRGIPPY
jgi:hypothetical protein